MRLERILITLITTLLSGSAGFLRVRRWNRTDRIAVAFGLAMLASWLVVFLLVRSLA